MAEGRVVVVGGGMSGLAAARVLAGLRPVSSERAPLPPRRVVLLEEEALGGKVRSGRVGPAVVDFGPDQFLRRDPSAERLATHLGLGADLVAPAVGNAAVYARGEMRMLPGGLVLGVPTDLAALSESGIVSQAAVARAGEDEALPGPLLSASDVGLAPPGEGAELGAGEIFRRRLGGEVVDRLIDPLLGGINAGRIDELSLALVAPQIASSLIGEREVLAPLRRQLAARSTRGSPFLGLRGGLGRLVGACREELEAAGVELREGARAVSIDAGPDGFAVRVRIGGTSDTLGCDGVVVAVPAHAASELLASAAPTAADELSKMEYASVVVTTLVFPPGALRLPEGSSGVLVPRVERRLMSAATWLSAKWPWVARDGSAVVRVSAGRYGDERPLELADDDLVARLRHELCEVAGIDAEPSEVAVVRFARSFPQYRPGHAEAVGRARAAGAEAGALELAGAAMGGIGVPACITSGETAALALARRLPA